jgi:glucose-1-phosphate thymidylyltransferase
MNIIVPMAGRGSRLRPHTLTVPKPLIPVAGKPIVERLVEDIVARSGEPVEEIAFVVGDFGAEVEAQLLAVAERLGARGRICQQLEPLGTAHAILCGRECLRGPVVVAFADTLFQADFTIDPEADGVLFVQRIEDPSAFGVVVTDGGGAIVDYVEKPQEWVGDLAMIGIYAFKDGERLERELQRLIDEDVRHGGEYQLPDALRNMTQAGLRFLPGEVREWMDCGNKAVTVDTNRRLLAALGNSVHPDAVVVDSVLLPPVHLGAGARIVRSVVGPFASIGEGTVVEDSRIDNALVQHQSVLRNARLSGAMIGSHAQYDGGVSDASLGDYSTVNAG